MSLLRMNVGMAVTMARTAGSRTAFALVSGLLRPQGTGGGEEKKVKYINEAGLFGAAFFVYSVPPPASAGDSAAPELSVPAVPLSSSLWNSE